jgi:hypothetical protein
MTFFFSPEVTLAFFPVFYLPLVTLKQRGLADPPCHALSLAEAFAWFRVVWSVNDWMLFPDFYWRSQLLLLPASGFDIGQEVQLKPLSV